MSTRSSITPRRQATASVVNTPIPVAGVPVSMSLTHHSQRADFPVSEIDSIERRFVFPCSADKTHLSDNANNSF